MKIPRKFVEDLYKASSICLSPVGACEDCPYNDRSPDCTFATGANTMIVCKVLLDSDILED